MPRITDDHFANMSGAGPKRIHEKIVQPEHSGRPWLMIFAGLVIAGGAGVAWWTGWLAPEPQPAALPKEPEPIAAAAPEPVKEVAPVAISAPEPVVEPVEVIEAAPAVDPAAVARQRRSLSEVVSNLGSGISTIERKVAEFRKDLVPLQAQVDDAAAMHWPKPRGTDTYEGYLIKLRDEAKARGDAHQATSLEMQWKNFRDDRNATLLEIERLQGLIMSSEKRLAGVKAERAAAQAQLAALP